MFVLPSIQLHPGDAGPMRHAQDEPPGELDLPSDGRRRAAVFDFDGTLTTGDTSLPFLRFVGGWGGMLRLGLMLPPTLLDVARELGTGPGSDTEEAEARGALEARLHGGATRAILAGRTRREVQRRAAEFAEEGIEPRLRRGAKARLRWHRSRGDVLVLVTASLEISVEPWARGVGFTHVLGTRLDTDADGRLTGALAGPYCWGREKLRRVEEALGDLGGWEVTAFGDSPGDKALLDRADRAVWVSAGTELSPDGPNPD